MRGDTKRISDGGVARVAQVITGSVTSPSYGFLGDGQLSNAQLASAVALPDLPAAASVAIVQNNHTQPIRFRYSGTPTATVGQRIPVGETVTLDVGAATLATVRLIYEATGTGTVDVSYFS